MGTSPSIASHRSVRALTLAGSFLLAALLASGAPSCGGDSATSVGTTSNGGNGATGATTATGGSNTGGVATGGQGGAGGAPECTSGADCTSGHCDVPAGKCVECLPAEDDCAPGQFCTSKNVCQVGCTDQADCNADTVCDEATHTCVGCVMDTNCPLGSICINGTCLPGCSPQQACQAGKSCCGSTCVDLDTDVNHCGDCTTICDPYDHGAPVCIGGQCNLGPCDPAWADCDVQSANGCEQNILQDGPCVCNPGDTQPCYTGAPGTENVGLCKGGISTCTNGTAWGPCTNQVLPAVELCNQLDDDCDGAIEAQPCEQCTPGTGTCNGNVGHWCKDDGLGYIDEVCDPLMGTTCNPGTGKCDGVCGLAQLGSSYIGCDYWPTVTANIVTPTFHFAVAVSNTTASPATVTITKGAATITSATVQPNDVGIYTLPWVDVLKDGAAADAVASVLAVDGAYRVRTNQPVTVYQFSPLEYALGGTNSYTNDASILLPSSAWTGKYRVATRSPWQFVNGVWYPAFYAVTASQDNTTVTLLPSASGNSVKPGAGVNPDGTGTIVLNSGDVLEVFANHVGGGPCSGGYCADPSDQTGTVVSANKPVQVIGGHKCTFVPYNIGYCDHLEESMFPEETLSSSYFVTAPLIPTGGAIPKVNMVRIVATKPNTTLTYDPPQPGAPPNIAAAGGWVEIANTLADFKITSSDPILVTQYMEGQDAGGGSGDPAMTIAVGEEQYRKSYLFHAPTNYEYSYVNVVAPTGATVTLDGANVAGFTPIGATGYSVARASVSNAGNGNHNMASSQPFGIAVYGYGQYTSYWYPGGSNLTKLHD